MKKQRGVQETFEERVRRLEKEKHYHGLSNAYYDRAVTLYDSKLKFQIDLRRSKEWELKYLRQNGVERVCILSSTGCTECRKLDGKTMSVEEALKSMPLPHERCSYVMNPDVGKPFCRCNYTAVAPDER